MADYKPGNPLDPAELNNFEGLTGVYQIQEAIDELRVDRKILQVGSYAMAGSSLVLSGVSAATTLEVTQVVPEPLASPEAGAFIGSIAIAAGALAVLFRWKAGVFFAQSRHLQREIGV